MANAEKIVKDLLAQADVQVNGNRRWDIQVHDPRFYDRVLSEGSLGLGESYMDNWWDCENLDHFFYHVISAKLEQKIKPNLGLIIELAKSKIINRQNRSRAKEVAQKHYDLSAELYESFLDPYNQYTCGYFKGTEDLNIAQEQKLELIAKKLQIKPTDKVLDIGCGWGGLAKFFASKYGCEVTGITISDEQFAYAKEYTKGLPVNIEKRDYRDLMGKFDKIVSVGMFEHVGHRNYRKFFEVVHDCLKEDGLFLLHTIGGNYSVSRVEPWINKYIFPNGMAPSIKQIGKAMEKLFVMEDWHNFGAYYEKTLQAWHQNFEKNWQKIKANYDQRFYRMWKYYLLSCAGAFAARDLNLWQIVLSKDGVRGGYQSIR